jgi:hypothetical protein
LLPFDPFAGAYQVTPDRIALAFGATQPFLNPP